MEKLRQLYADYLEEAYQVRKKAPAFAGIFGLGEDPRKHPCHDTFYRSVQGWVAQFVSGAPDPQQALEATSFMLEEPKKHVGAEGYWFVYVCIGFIRDLIPYLSGEDCKALAVRMNTLYPRRDRMPLQQETLKMLQKAGK